jgi:hypothetical protein
MMTGARLLFFKRTHDATIARVLAFQNGQKSACNRYPMTASYFGDQTAQKGSLDSVNSCIGLHILLRVSADEIEVSGVDMGGVSNEGKKDWLRKMRGCGGRNKG